MKALRLTPVRERGVALVVAVLVAAIATSAITAMFARQWASIRVEQNKRSNSQIAWLIRGGIDWVCLVLDEDTKSSAQDHLGEVWATKLKPTDLATFIGDHSLNAEDSVLFSGQLADAQAKLNIRNLAQQDELATVSKRALFRLGVLLEITPASINLLVAAVERMLPRRLDISAASQANTITSYELHRLEDLAVLEPNLKPVLDKLSPYVTLLPVPSKINLNTTSDVLLAAVLDINLLQARQILLQRSRAFFRYATDLKTVFSQLPNNLDILLNTTSHFYELAATIHNNQLNYQTQALLSRQDGLRCHPLWLKRL